MGENWWTLGDAECKRILSLSREELEAEVRARGENPEDVIAEVDRVIGEAKVEAYRRSKKLFV